MLSAAREVFGEHGIDAPTSRIAQRAGVSTSTVYRHFPSRSDLLPAVFSARVEECVASVLDAADDVDPWRGFSSAITALLTVDADARGLTSTLLAAIPHGESAFEDQRRIAEMKFAGLVQRAKDAGTLRRDFLREDFMLALQANSGLTVGNAAARRSASAKLARLLLRGLAADQGARTSAD